MATPTLPFGRLEEFSPEAGPLSAYLERVEIFFAANSVADEKKVPVFLNAIGATVYSTLRDLLAPENPITMSFADIVAALKAHYEPKSLVIVERFHFHKREQAPGESIAEYVAELRRLAAKCAFANYLDEALRDRFVCGLNSEAVQKRLLGESGLTIAKAVEIAQNMEAAHNNAQAMKSAPPVSQVVPADHANAHVVQPSQAVPQGATPTQDTNMVRVCYRCGSNAHGGNDCTHRNTTCHKCGKVGHLARVCRSGGRGRRGNQPRGRGRGQIQSWVDRDNYQEDPVVVEDLWEVLTTAPQVKPYKATLLLNWTPVTMEIDTGAAVTLIPESRLRSLLPDLQLSKTTMRLRTYTAQPITVVGQAQVEVRYQDYAGSHVITVVKGSGPTLLGRDWLSCIKLDWAAIRQVESQGNSTAIDQLLSEYAEVFAKGAGTMKHIRAHLTLKAGAVPRFKPPRSVPYSIRARVGQELDRLEEAGVIRKVTHSSWAAPLVPVPKKDGTLRLCGDYKVTINPALLVDQYPLPKPVDLMACLTGGVCFSKIDLSSAYQQMLLDDESAQLVTVNTHQGLYEFTRLPFGVASAPAVFQRAMDTILRGIPQVICYLDDILVTGRNVSEHNDHLAEVLKWLQEHGVRLKKEKCEFGVESVVYLGHRIDAKGVHTTDEKVKTIIDTPPPTNLTKLRSFLGMISYYAKFISNMSTLLHPLYTLLRANEKWRWSKECAQAFEKAKRLLTEAPILAHYDPERPIILATDASAYGLGAVLSQVNADGTEQPISFASRTLTASERNYSQLDKEALSLMFGVRRFHNYLYGRHFKLQTDHKPLTFILGPKQGIPPLAAARLQRWAVILAGYSYDIEYRPTDAHANADGLSRLPLPDNQPEGNPEDATVFMIGQLEALPVRASTVAAETSVDPILKRVARHLRSGWPDRVSESLQPFWRRKEELSLEGGCILWGMRVIIPKKLQPQILSELHQGHPGIVKMKAVARSHVWWPCLDSSIEQTVRGCEACQLNRHMPAKAPLHPWSWPMTPWERIHVDFAGPIQGKMLFLVVDAHSKWPEVHILTSTTAARTIQVLREIFARYGVPKQLVSDNGPQFTSQDFAEFMGRNGIKHTRTAPYHPASNGAVERLVQSVKHGVRAGVRSGVPLEQALQAFLLRYRTTPHTTTGVAPSTLMLGRDLRTQWDLLRPELQERVEGKQAQQSMSHNQHSRKRELVMGSVVWARSWREGPVWVKARVQERLGPVSYSVQLETGELWRRHIDHLREGCGSVTEGNSSTEISNPETRPERPTGSAVPETPVPQMPLTPPEGPLPDTEQSNIPTSPVIDHPDVSANTGSGQPAIEQRSTSPRYPRRSRQPPERLYSHLSPEQT